MGENPPLAIELPREAVIYCRVSSAPQSVGYSFARQMKFCQEWADKNGFEVVAVFSEIKSAFSKTGIAELPVLDQAATVARLRDAVLVFEAWDRVTRGGPLPKAKRLVSAMDELE